MPAFSITCKSESTGVEWPRSFNRRENAEVYLREMERSEDYSVKSKDFTNRLSDEELDKFIEEQEILHAEDKKAQDACYDKTRANWLSPANQPCEVCGKEHRNYECCDDCNRDNHRCHFCGDSLGHEEISACYRQIAREEAWEEENSPPS